MSAIAGVWRLDNSPAERPELNRMLDVLAHRGPDVSSVWLEDSVGLGHRMLWTTPESLTETLPLQMNSLVITADARIDNRDDLFRLFDVVDSLSDSELILMAYRRWGEQCVEKLLGDFAFAIWDGSEQRLFCARDHFGIRPFVYFRSANVFAFASEIKALLTLPFVPRRINEAKLASYLIEDFDDKENTFYADIYRLPPAHSLVITPEKLHLQTYWTLSDRTYQASDKEYAEGFFDIFKEAVRCRTRSVYPVGALLSGGLDSSSVVAVARDLIPSQAGGGVLRTFTADFPDVARADERRFVDAVLAQGNVESFRICASELSPLYDKERMCGHFDEPIPVPNLFMQWALYEVAQQQHIRVLLTGLDGDTAVSHGWARLVDLASQRDWDRLVTETKSAASLLGAPDEAILRYWVYPYLMDLSKHFHFIALAQLISRLHNDFLISRKRVLYTYGIRPWIPGWLRRLRRRSLAPSFSLHNSIINNSFARQQGIRSEQRFLHRKRLEAFPEKEAYRHRVYNGLVTLAFEVQNISAFAFGMESRQPFYDKRLIEYSASLPADQKMNQGWTRVVLRRAMEGRLPPEVQWRQQKAFLGMHFISALLEHERAVIDDVLVNNPGHLERFIDCDNLQEVIRQYIEDPKDRSATTVWAALMLGLWLRRGTFES
jgi:asparagine synthase (glutamine-hydrolysing)